MRSKRKLKKPVKYAIVILLILIGFLLVYKFETSSVSNKDSSITYEVKEGSTFNSISSSLKSKNLIKSELFYKIYIKIHKPNNLQAGFYELNSNMNVKELVNTLNGSAKSKMISITFKEGINFMDVASIISDKMGIELDSIYNKLKDQEYLDSLIDSYWFLTDDIKNTDIYYPLEGYLFPDTYLFNKSSTIEDIFKIMLDNTLLKLDKYKSDIDNGKYSIHEIMTMASIVEKEASNSSDRSGVAGVFYNRLDTGMSLGSDVTTYYGLKLNLTERDLTKSDLNSSNGYNTRNSKMAGKLPVGPICMPGLESIVAAINPKEHDYVYFVADKTGKTYFTKNSSEHANIIAKLKREGKWYEY
ncbi:MAG: endolytic transglycosylase MltG [Bacilli bacterium]|nr:endolytic transglycosylase MltG [Bacilli bacterium]